MSAPELHVAFVHFPIVGALIAVVLISAGAARKDSRLLRVGMLAFVLAAAFAFPVYFSGEPAEEIVEHLAGVSHDAIEVHEDAALWAFIGLEVLGALGVVGLFVFRDRGRPAWYGPTLAVLGIMVTGWILWTANLGGRISHPEIRPDFTPSAEIEDDDG